jgi:hypothetical protein
VKAESWHLVQAGHELRIHPDFQGRPAGVALSIGSRALVFLAPRSGSHRGEKMVYREFRAEDIARARLIAAAPDLLDACKLTIEAGYHDEASRAAVFAAQAAIAKAEQP